MKFTLRHNKLDQKGFDHVFLAVIVVVFVAILGTFYVVYSRAASSNYAIVHSSGKCLNNQKGLAASGNPVEIYRCADDSTSPVAAQDWTIKNDTIVNRNGLCLAAKGRSAGKYVVIQRCDGSSLQKWTVNKTAKTIISKPSGLCLGVDDGMTEDKTLVQVKTCNDYVLQQWTVQDAAAAATISSFAATPASVVTGKTATLSWTTTNAKSCSVTPGGPTDTTVTSWTTPAQTTVGDKVFTLTCKNDDGVAISQSATLKVTALTTSSTTGFDVGMSYGGNADPSAFESAWGVKLESRRTFYQSNGQTGAVNAIKADIAAGRKTSSVSFKLPASWADMAAGKQDTWAQNLANTLAAANTSGHTIRVAFHHEPENDTGTNDGGTVAGRDAWKATQARLSYFFDKPGMQYVVILMGYHSFSGTATMKSLWNLDASIPTNAKVKGIGFDLYQTKGVDGSTKWLDMNTTYYTKIGPWAKAHNMAWGVSETGIAATAFTEKPTYFTDNVAQMKAQGGSWYEYFNSDLNSPDPKWSFTVNEARSKAYGAILKAERAN